MGRELAVPDKNPCKRFLWQVKSPTAWSGLDAGAAQMPHSISGADEGSVAGFPGHKGTSDSGRAKSNPQMKQKRREMLSLTCQKGHARGIFMHR